MTATGSNLAPLQVDATALPIGDLRFDPAVVSKLFRHSGNEYAGTGTRPSAKPAWTFKAPLLAAYTLIGLKGLLCSTFQGTFAVFSGGFRQSGANHTRIEHNTSCKTFLAIDGCSVDENGHAMADCIAMGLSPADGITHPYKITPTVSLPAPSEPQLHTLGPFARNGTRIDGALNNGFKLNHRIYIPDSVDGDSFPRQVFHQGGDPTLMIDHEDPLSLINTLGLMGDTAATSIAIFFAGLDPTTQLRQTTGLSITVSSKLARVANIGWDLTRPSRGTVIVEPLSSSSTHPFTVNTTATLP